MKHNLFQMSELDALLGDYKQDFDVEGIIADATEIDEDGDRVWTDISDEEMNAILERHDHPRTKAEFRAMRETLGLTHQRLADDLGVKVLSVKRWESPKYPQQAPAYAWELLDMLMAVQDSAVQAALDQVRLVADEQGSEPREVIMPYWSSRADYMEHHYMAAESDASWTEVNATSRRTAIMLTWLGYKVRWVDGVDNPVPRVE